METAQIVVIRMCGWNAGVEGAETSIHFRQAEIRITSALEATPHEVSPRPETHMESAGLLVLM